MVVRGNLPSIDESSVFHSLTKGSMRLNEVFESVLEFIRADVSRSYRISIGTDSQVGSRTLFVTCIIVHRVGKGAIGFLHKSEIPRPIRNLREKIYLETCASLQLAYLFNEDWMNKINQIIGEKVTFEFHIDIGPRGETKALISEMVGMVKGINFVPKVKPDSFCASTFADKYTKAI